MYFLPFLCSFRNITDEYEAKNKALQTEIEDLKRNVSQCQRNCDEKVRSLENVRTKDFFLFFFPCVHANESYSIIISVLACK